MISFKNIEEKKWKTHAEQQIKNDLEKNKVGCLFAC